MDYPSHKYIHKDPYKEKRTIRSKEEVVDVIPEARDWSDAGKGS